MNKTKIEYLDYTWNPIKMKCTKVSAGCANCWAIQRAKMLAKNPSIYRDQQKAYAGGPPMLDYKELEAPLHLKKPARIGVQFMSDLFHENIDGEFLKDIFSVMRACDRHTFFLLTKRPQNVNKKYFEYFGTTSYSHVWLGVSVEDQKTADERIPILLQIPAAHRWISIEPMLGSVDLEDYFYHGKGHYEDTEGGQRYHLWDQTLNWIVLGGETAPKARPLHPDWVRSVRDQCQAAGVPFFFKSWGDGLILPKEKRRLLDGRQWNEKSAKEDI